MSVARDLAACTECGVENRHGDRIALRTADDIPHHSARGSDDGRFGCDFVVEALVEREQVLLPVDRVGDHAGGRVAIGTRDGRSHRVERGVERLFAVQREFVFERNDPFEQLPVLGRQGEEAFHAGKCAVDSACQPVGLREDARLREMRRVRIVTDRHRFDDDEQERDVNAPQEFE